MKITGHFDSDEFRCKDGTLYPDKWFDSRLVILCGQLEIVRGESGKRVVHINSGYRTLAYNKSVGGARSSQHVEGRAADIVIAGFLPSVVHDLILKLYNEKRIQIGGLGSYPTFTHIDIRLSDRLVRWSGSRNSN